MPSEQHFIQETLLKNGIRSFYDLNLINYKDFNVILYKKNVTKEEVKHFNLNFCKNYQFFKPIYKPNLDMLEFMEKLFTDDLELKYYYLFFLEFKKNSYIYSLDVAEDKPRKKYETQFSLQEIKIWKNYFSNPEDNIPTFLLTDLGYSEITKINPTFESLPLIEQREVIKKELLLDFLQDFNYLMNYFMHYWNVIILKNNTKVNIQEINQLNTNYKIFLNSQTNSSNNFKNSLIQKVYDILNNL